MARPQFVCVSDLGLPVGRLGRTNAFLSSPKKPLSSPLFKTEKCKWPLLSLRAGGHWLRSLVTTSSLFLAVFRAPHLTFQGLSFFQPQRFSPLLSSSLVPIGGLCAPALGWAFPQPAPRAPGGEGRAQGADIP